MKGEGFRLRAKETTAAKVKAECPNHLGSTNIIKERLPCNCARVLLEMQAPAPYWDQ